jgi:hypothetical protein
MFLDIIHCNFFFFFIFDVQNDIWNLCLPSYFLYDAVIAFVRKEWYCRYHNIIFFSEICVKVWIYRGTTVKYLIIQSSVTPDTFILIYTVINYLDLRKKQVRDLCLKNYNTLLVFLSMFVNWWSFTMRFYWDNIAASLKAGNPEWNLRVEHSLLYNGKITETLHFPYSHELCSWSSSYFNFISICLVSDGPWFVKHVDGTDNEILHSLAFSHFVFTCLSTSCITLNYSAIVKRLIFSFEQHAHPCYLKVTSATFGPLPLNTESFTIPCSLRAFWIDKGHSGCLWNVIIFSKYANYLWVTGHNLGF